MIFIDGERSRRWVPFAKQKLAQLKGLGLLSKVLVVSGYRIKLLAIDDIEKIHITAPPYTSVGGGYGHALISDPTGRLWAWGFNGKGQLGLGDTEDRTEPIRHAVAGAPWAMVARGRGASSAAIRKDGTLWVWGDNNGSTFSYPIPALNGTLGLGLGQPDAVLVPTQVGTERTWAFVTAGARTMYAVKTDGTLWAWGLNTGYLGLGAVMALSVVSVPTQVGTDTDWRTVSADVDGAMAIKADGTLWAVGQNRFGALGLGDDVPRYAFTQVGAHTWRRVVVGFDSAIGIKSDGTLWACGNAPFYKTPGGLNGFVQIDGGEWADVYGDEYVLLAVKSSGALWSAGYLCDVRLGRGPQTCPVGDESGPLAEVGQYATDGGIFATQHAVIAVSASAGQWLWGLAPGVSNLGNAVLTPQEQTTWLRLLLPATEPLRPPWI